MRRRSHGAARVWPDLSLSGGGRRVARPGAGAHVGAATGPVPLPMDRAHAPLAVPAPAPRDHPLSARCRGLPARAHLGAAPKTSSPSIASTPRSGCWRDTIAFVSLGDAVEMLAGRKPLVPYSLVLTFDDGYRNNITHALPLLRRNQVPATIYLATGHVEERRPFSFDRLDYALQHAAPADAAQAVGRGVAAGTAMGSGGISGSATRPRPPPATTARCGVRWKAWPSRSKRERAPPVGRVRDRPLGRGGELGRCARRHRTGRHVAQPHRRPRSARAGRPGGRSAISSRAPGT